MSEAVARTRRSSVTAHTSARKGSAVEAKRSRRRYAVLAVLIAVAFMAACSPPEPTGSGYAGSGDGGSASRATSVHYRTPPPSGDQTDSIGQDQYGVSTIWGQVTVRGTGEPYPGVTVEFKHVYGGNVHTETDANGRYALPVPPGVYTALALDLENTNAGFDVVGRSSAVSVPPSTRVDFEAYPIV
jgi:hypothetical protein